MNPVIQTLLSGEPSLSECPNSAMLPWDSKPPHLPAHTPEHPPLSGGHHTMMASPLILWMPLDASRRRPRGPKSIFDLNLAASCWYCLSSASFQSHSFPYSLPPYLRHCKHFPFGVKHRAVLHSYSPIAYTTSMAFFSGPTELKGRDSLAHL